MPAETHAARGRRLVDALIVWITPDQVDEADGEGVSGGETMH